MEKNPKFMPTKEKFFVFLYSVHIHTGIPITIIAPQHNKNNMKKYVAGISFRFFYSFEEQRKANLKNC